MARKRHLSRIAAMQAIFESQSRSGIDLLEAVSRDSAELGDIDQVLAESIVQGVTTHLADITQSILEHAPGWTIERMDPIARAVLFVGAFELLYMSDTPPAVVMNEAIDIAKEYGTDESGRFVNGVLNAIAKSLKGPEAE